MKQLIWGTLFLVIYSSVAIASEFEITKIKANFDKDTPGFGKFEITTTILNNTSSDSKLVIGCFYMRYTKPGVYYKNQPNIIKQYKIIELKNRIENHVVFDEGFRSFHPETLGEIIISIVGKGVIKSIPLKTRFHPKSND